MEDHYSPFFIQNVNCEKFGGKLRVSLKCYPCKFYKVKLHTLFSSNPDIGFDLIVRKNKLFANISQQFLAKDIRVNMVHDVSNTRKYHLLQDRSFETHMFITATFQNHKYRSKSIN